MNYIRVTDADVDKFLPGILVNYLMAHSSSVLWVSNQTLFLHGITVYIGFILLLN